MAVLGNPTDGATAPVDLAAFDAAQGREEVMEHGHLVGRLRALIAHGYIPRADMHVAEEAAEALEAAQARIAALEAELSGAREAALEEAAKVAEGQRTDDGSLWDCAAESITAAIRALKAAQP